LRVQIGETELTTSLPPIIQVACSREKISLERLEIPKICGLRLPLITVIRMGLKNALNPIEDVGWPVILVDLVQAEFSFPVGV
jgi:hypothetical protein